MKVTMVLAESARQRDGKIDLYGVGWQMSPPTFTGMAVGLVFEVPWADASEEWHSITVSISKRVPEGLETPEGEPLLVLEKPEGFKAHAGLALVGGPVLGATLCPIPPVTLEPNSRYTVRVKVDGLSDDRWTQDFYTVSE